MSASPLRPMKTAALSLPEIRSEALNRAESAPPLSRDTLSSAQETSSIAHETKGSCIKIFFKCVAKGIIHFFRWLFCMNKKSKQPPKKEEQVEISASEWGRLPKLMTRTSNIVFSYEILAGDMSRTPRVRLICENDDFAKKLVETFLGIAELRAMISKCDVSRSNAMVVLQPRKEEGREFVTAGQIVKQLRDLF